MKNIEINGKYYYIFGVNKVYVAKVNELSPCWRVPHYNISLFKDEDMLDFFMNINNVFSDDLYTTREDTEEEIKEREKKAISNINESLDKIDLKLKYNERYKKMFIEKFRYLFEGSDDNESDNRCFKET